MFPGIMRRRTIFNLNLLVFIVGIMRWRTILPVVTARSSSDAASDFGLDLFAWKSFFLVNLFAWKSFFLIGLFAGV